VFTPSHFLTLPGVCDVIPRLPLGPHLCNAFALTLELPSSWSATLQPFALVVSPKLGLRHKEIFMHNYDGIYNCNGLKYNPFENLTTFDSLFFMGIKI